MIISRDILNKNLVTTGFRLYPNNTVDTVTTEYNDIIRSIDQVKEYLIKEKNAQPGQTVMLGVFYWPDYLSWFFACAELGLILAVVDYIKTEAGLKKFEVYGDIDYVVYDLHYPPGFEKFQDNLINSNDVRNYNYSGTPTPVWATSDTTLMYTTTSGTTGKPKLITNSHRYFWDLLDRNANLYGLKESDRCFHSKGLHHGSVSCAYFLPTIKYCSTHFHAPYGFAIDDLDEDILIPKWVELFQAEKINKCLMFYEQIDRLCEFLDISKKQHNDLTVFVLSRLKPSHIEKIVKEFNYKIISIFGSVEIGGPQFLPEITLENCDTYNPGVMGKPVDDMYKLKINSESLLEIKTPWTDEYVCLGDRFEVDNGNWIFKGRNNIYKINGRTIYALFLFEIVEGILGLKHEVDFDIIFDQECDSIYIRSNTAVDLKQVNIEILNLINEKEYQLNKNLVAPREQFFSGIKFDPESIRIICRGQVIDNNSVLV
jgi:acyl-coenzyme A synthetase/AMP-(fatty) acid ligase